MEPIRIPRHIDTPQRLLFWTADELVPFSILFVVGLLSGNLFICALLGIGSTFVFRRYRDSRPDGYMVHALYWSGLMPVKSRATINPYQRRILP